MEFVGVGFEVVVRVVEPGDGVEARAFGGTAGDDDIGHADDGRGVHAAAEFGENRPIGAESALDGCGQGRAEVFFVFGVRAVANALARIKIPIFADGVLSWSEEHGRGRRDGMDANVGCQMRRREYWYCEPAGDVLFTDFEGFAREKDERIEDGAPSSCLSSNE